MQYKTITLGLLESHPKLHERLRLSRKLLSELDRYATELRTAHLRWKGEGLDPSAAMELAVEELQTRIAQEAERYEA
ncbi:MAG TPA: hypothetical protein VG097_07310 [Gemmata sp.]|jgi:hypothetical protein|nr:hypothetical protein [Gemmata sp.]